jgi:NADPH:quinone reductase
MKKKMNKIVIVEKCGGVDVLKMKESPDPKLKDDGDVLIKHTVLGLNFMDIYHRNGSIKTKLPFTPGFEACGYIEETKGNVGNFVKGDRVAYATAPMGAYCERRVLNYKHLVRVPHGVSDEVAAAILLKGLTAHYLTRITFMVKKGQTILVHAAAGGVGLFMCQLASYFGVRVIGTVGNDEKGKLAKANGCTHVINYTKEDFHKRLIELTKGEGVDAVYDGIGKKTFMKSLNCVAPFGLLASTGFVSGKPPPIEIDLLSKKSIFLTVPNLFTYKQFRMELAMTANEVFELFKRKVIKSNINFKYKFDEIAEAHSDLENRKTVGSNIIILD